MTEKIPDFFLYTDGSGYQDGYGGAAALVLSAQHNIWKVSFAAYCGTTVERASVTLSGAAHQRLILIRGRS